MAQFVFASPMPVPAGELFDWHSRPGAFLRLQPPWEQVEVIDQKGTFGEGYTLTMRVPILGPIHGSWVAEVHSVEPGHRFQDRQLKGPFAHWNHTHTMTADGPEQSTLEDSIEFRPPLGPLGDLFGTPLVRKRLASMFRYRHALTLSDVRRHRKYRDRPRLTVAITGSTGLVGSDLCLFLQGGGHDVVRLVRGEVKPAPFRDGTRSLPWNAESDPKTLEGLDAVVHLGADNIADGRWNEAKRKSILESRTGPTRRLCEALAKLDRKPKVLVSASAVGIYGDRKDEELSESSNPGTGFLADVCKAWEAATEPAVQAGIRVVNLRIGVVLNPKGGALGKQLPAFRTGNGAVLGSGKQWVSWITGNDLIGAIHHAIQTDSLSGPVNAVAPHPETNRDFGRTLAHVLRRPYLFTVPAPILRVLFGEIADAALLASMKVVPQKLLDSGFVFDHSDLDEALRFVLGR